MTKVLQDTMTQAEHDERDVAQAAFDATLPQRTALAEIHRLESQVTNRRLREAYADSTWLDAQEALIATERAKLKE